TSGFDTLRKQADIIRIIGERGLPYEVQLPDLIDLIDIQKVHDREYVAAVMDGEPYGKAGSSGLAWHPGRFGEVHISTSAVVAAVQHALVNRVNAGCTSSGLHHAKASEGAGYCTFNGLAIAAIKAVEAGAKRVLILDLDAHCGGGTASLIEGLAGIEQVDVSVSSFDHYASTQNARLYMARGDNYLEVVSDALAAIIDPESIDVVIYNAGMDPHERAGGATGITANVLAERERTVFEWANSRGIPVAFTLAGGYTFGVTADELADLHLLTFDAAHTSAPIAR
ncbi:MAG: Rhodococcus phage, partial [Actinomycetota bacterium]